jgi:AraC family transcriptional regulator
MNTPDRTTAAAFPRYVVSTALADSAALGWEGLYARRYRMPRVVDHFLVPATPEPFISYGIAGSAEFRERDVGGQWIRRTIGPGHIFVTRSKTPYEVAHTSRPGDELEVVHIHVAVDLFLATLRQVHGDKAPQLEVTDFFGDDRPLALLCQVCVELLLARAPGRARRVQDLAQLFAAYLAETYVEVAAEKPDFQRGLPIWQLRKVQDYVGEHVSEEMTVETLATVAGLSPFHFSRVFKQATGMSPLQYVTRERITRAQQLTRETSRSLIEIGLEVGYSNPSHFAKVFRKVVGMTPTEFRSSL